MRPEPFQHVPAPRILCAHPATLDNLGLSDDALMERYAVVAIRRDVLCPPETLYIMQQETDMDTEEELCP